MTEMNESETKMQKAVEAVEKEFQAVRTGRANPGILDKIVAPYYGADTPLNNMANISVSDGRTLVITPFDKTVIKDIEKAISDSDLGLTPTNDGTVIRITVPALTEERRKELVKHVKKLAEDGKVSIRNARRDALDKNKKSDGTEDDKKKFQDDVQKVTDSYVKKIDDLTSEKEKELMTI